MTTHRSHLDPPRLGVAILNRLADRNEALAGDLLEGFQLKQSRVWFWREFAGAILTGGFRKSILIRPIKLVEFPSLHPPKEDFAASRLRLQTLGLSASPVSGVSGFSIVMVIWLITALQPVLWALLSVGAICGIAIGIYRVRRARLHPLDPGADMTTLVLLDHHSRR